MNKTTNLPDSDLLLELSKLIGKESNRKGFTLGALLPTTLLGAALISHPAVEMLGTVILFGSPVPIVCFAFIGGRANRERINLLWSEARKLRSPEALQWFVDWIRSPRWITGGCDLAYTIGEACQTVAENLPVPGALKALREDSRKYLDTYIRRTRISSWRTSWESQLVAAADDAGIGVQAEHN